MSEAIATASGGTAVLRSGALPKPLQDIARRYIGAQRQAGQALLDAAHHMHEARQIAQHGEWQLFLDATNTSATQAKRLLDIHRQSVQSPIFADAIRSDWLRYTVAAELAQESTPPELIEQTLQSETRPKLADVRQVKDDVKSTTMVDLSPLPAAPSLDDMFLRLSAHGYDRVGQPRLKGSVSYYTFRDRASDLDDESRGVLELAEGELSYWLAELDSTAAYAQQRQQVYLDARDRFDRLGWRLERDGKQFALYQPSGKHHGTTRQIEPMIKTLEGLEREPIAKHAEPALTIAQLDACMPKNLEAAGYYWKSAQPIVIAHNDGWAGDAPLIATAISLAADREKARGEPITVFPGLNDKECRALIREVKLFIERGLGRDYPTIGQALRIAARMALEATE